MTQGERIREARKKAGLTQSELAARLGIPYQSVSQWERNTRNPKQETLHRISEALGVSFFDLLSERERAIYDRGFKEGSAIEEWSNNLIDELWKQEGYSYSDIECELIHAFSSLNQPGQKEAVKRVSELAEIPRYQRQAPPQSPPPPPEGTDTTQPEKPPESP